MKKLPKITIKAIPHKKQRYKTVGDYWKNKDESMEFRVSILDNEYYQFSIILHELVEYFLCKKDRIRLNEIDNFDLAYEKAREEGNRYAPCGCKIRGNPGDDIHSPYHHQHIFATRIQQMFLKELRKSNKKSKKEGYIKNA
jgi:hypothetical protein